MPQLVCMAVWLWCRIVLWSNSMPISTKAQALLSWPWTIQVVQDHLASVNIIPKCQHLFQILELFWEFKTSCAGISSANNCMLLKRSSERITESCSAEEVLGENLDFTDYLKYQLSSANAVEFTVQIINVHIVCTFLHLNQGWYIGCSLLLVLNQYWVCVCRLSAGIKDNMYGGLWKASKLKF